MSGEGWLSPTGLGGQRTAEPPPLSLARLMYSPGASSRHVGLVDVGAAQAPGFYLPGDFYVQLGLRTTAPEPASAGGARGRA